MSRGEATHSRVLRNPSTNPSLNLTITLPRISGCTQPSPGLSLEQSQNAMLRCLLEGRADPAFTDRHGTSALVAAVSGAPHGHQGAVELLLARKGSPETPNAHGQTPLILAAGKGRRGIVEDLSLDRRSPEPHLKSKPLTLNLNLYGGLAEGESKGRYS